MSLWLVRHAAPLVDAGLCYGRSDIAADARHTAQAARALAAALPRGIVVHTSLLQRCELLAQTLCGLRPDLALKTDPRLVEMDFGHWEGRPWQAIGAAAVDAWQADFAHHRPGGGESVSSFMARVGHAFDEARAAGPSCVWITHAGVIRAARLLARGVRCPADARQWPTEAVGFGEWTTLEFAPSAAPAAASRA